MSEVKLINEKEIRLLIAEGETEQALGELGKYFNKYAYPDLEDNCALLTGQFNDYEQSKNSGTASFDDLNQEAARIDSSLLSLNRKLFAKLEEAQINTGKEKVVTKKNGIREDKFKRQIFILLLLSKIIIISWVFFHVTTGGLNNEHALSIITILLPVLSVYTATVFDDFLKDRYVSYKIKTAPYIKNSLRWTAYILFALYTLFILNIIGNQAAGEYCDKVLNVDGTEYCVGLETLNKWLGLIETGLGVYIGRLVFTLFKKG